MTTGADDDGRHRIRQLLVGIAGWVLWAALIVLLASQASDNALDAAVFLVTTIVTLALLTVLTGAVLLRPALIRERGRQPAPVGGQLKRPPPADSHAELGGEIGIETRGGERRYVPLTRVTP